MTRLPSLFSSFLDLLRYCRRSPTSVSPLLVKSTVAVPGTASPSPHSATRIAILNAHAKLEVEGLTREKHDLLNQRDKLLQAHYAGAVPLDQLKDEQDRISTALTQISTGSTRHRRTTPKRRPSWRTAWTSRVTATPCTSRRPTPCAVCSTRRSSSGSTSPTRTRWTPRQPARSRLNRPVFDGG